MATPADAPAFVRAGLLSVGQGVWGTTTPAVTIGLLKRADARRCLVNPAYAAEVQRAPDSVPGWRRQVVDWLQELSVVFRLDLNTFQTAVSFFDRILSLVHISSKQLQICGLAALFFATKVLETAPFRAEEIEKYFSQVATPKEVMRAELNMLHIMGWDANAFTPAAYVRGLLQLVPHEALSRDLQAISEVLVARATLEYSLLHHPTSVMGLACVAAACELRGFDASPLVSLLQEAGVDAKVDRPLCAWLVNAFRAEVDPAVLPAPMWPPQADPQPIHSAQPPSPIKGAPPPAPPDRVSPTLVSDALDQRPRHAPASARAARGVASAAAGGAAAAVTDDDPLLDCCMAGGPAVMEMDDDCDTYVAASCGGVSRASSALSSSTSSAPGDME